MALGVQLERDLDSGSFDVRCLEVVADGLRLLDRPSTRRRVPAFQGVRRGVSSAVGGLLRQGTSPKSDQVAAKFGRSPSLLGFQSEWASWLVPLPDLSPLKCLSDLPRLSDVIRPEMACTNKVGWGIGQGWSRVGAAALAGEEEDPRRWTKESLLWRPLPEAKARSVPPRSWHGSGTGFYCCSAGALAHSHRSAGVKVWAPMATRSPSDVFSGLSATTCLKQVMREFVQEALRDRFQHSSRFTTDSFIPSHHRKTVDVAHPYQLIFPNVRLCPCVLWRAIENTLSQCHFLLAAPAGSVAHTAHCQPPHRAKSEEGCSKGNYAITWVITVLIRRACELLASIYIEQVLREFV